MLFNSTNKYFKTTFYHLQVWNKNTFVLKATIIVQYNQRLVRAPGPLHLKGCATTPVSSSMKDEEG